MKTRLFAFMLTACAAFSVAQAVAQDGYEENALYVRFKASASPKAPATSRHMATENIQPFKKLQGRYALHQTVFSMRTLNNALLERTFELRFDSTARIDDLIEELRQDDRIELVERIPVAYIQGGTAGPAMAEAEGGDPYYETSYGSWHLNLIHAEEAWARQTGKPEVTVAVVDNAVWGDHPDLGIAPENQYNIKDGTTGNSAPPATVSQDPNCGSLSNCPAYNWSHGTHCAGAVGAIRGNGLGIASIGSGVTLMGVSCPGTAASGLEVSGGFSGISYAAEHGADIISVSWGNYSISETDRAIIQACIDKGIIVVAAAGNDGYKESPMYPAYLPGVISVSAVNDNRQISSFSNYGDWVTVASPGGFVMSGNTESKTSLLSTTYCTSQNYRMNGYPSLTGEYYDGMYGTSMATPVVSGLCGLLLSADSTLTPYLMREILMSSAQALNMGNNKGICANSGVIDAAAALSMLPKGKIAAPASVRLERTDRQLHLSWKKPDTENAVASYQVFVDNVFAGETENTEYTYDIDNTNKMYRVGVRAIYQNNDTSLRAGADLFVPTLYDVDVTVQPEGCGTIEGAGAYPVNQTVTLTAHAVKGCSFTRWSEDNTVLGRDTILEYTVKNNTEIRASFSGSPDNVANSRLESASSLRVYPNPANSRITIEGNGTNVYEVELYAPNGQRVMNQSFAEGVPSREVDVESLAAGTYIIKVRTDNGWQISKVAKI